MVALSGMLSQFKPVKILVVGDLILDSYTFGKAQRISPEAPVAVVLVSKEEHKAGGVGNTALNIQALGAEVSLLGRVGDDRPGSQLLQELNHQTIATSAILVQPNFSTPKKNRIIAANQQVVRIDHEVVEWLPESLEQQLIEQLPQLLNSIDAIAVSDYGKGFLTDTLLRELIDLANEREIPIIVDPKGTQFQKYSGVTLIKPNMKEAYQGVQADASDPLEAVAEKLLEVTDAKTVMITRSEEGISLFHHDRSVELFPVEVQEVKDVTGAGDTVLSTVTCCLANGLSPAEAAKLANVAAGIAIEHIGCSVVSLPQLARRLLEKDRGQKLYDEDHIYTIQQALQGEHFALIGLDQETGLTPAIYAQIQEIASKHEHPLLIYVRDPNPSREFVNFLTALNEVEFVILKSRSLESLCQQISPDYVYTVQDQQLKESPDYLALL